MNVKEWFENGTNLKIKELRYLKPPKMPYFLFTNSKTYRGADEVNNICINNIIIERYSMTDNEEDAREVEKVNNFLEKNHYEYDIDKDWLDTEELYSTTWTLKPILEKIREE